jgi:hypothetical protein
MAVLWIWRPEIAGQTPLLQPRRQRGYDPAMSEDTPETPTLPDRLSVNPKSPFYNAELLERGIGIRFNGAEKNNVEEYCVSEGWVRLAVGKTVDRNGNAMTVKYKGTVEPYLR